MAKFNPYLHFLGNTEEAFAFYKSVFGDEYIRVVRFGELPPSPDFKLPEEHLNKIMHIALTLANGNVLMGSDAIMEYPDRKFTFGDNFHIAISAESMEEADNLYNKLSVGGRIDMPIAPSPWGSYFGMFVDQYGVQWTIDFDTRENN